MARKSPFPNVPRTTALCYIRVSFNPNGAESDSPERQESYIQAACERQGFNPEWYSDAKGHRSGREVKNRPGWQALEKRLADPDVGAIVMYDISRAHRKQWRMGELLERLDTLGVKLVQTDPVRGSVDSATPQGRMILQIWAQQDEAYAEDVSRRTTASIVYRKTKGVTVGRPPFGTVRDKDTGYLQPSPEGVWLRTDGSWVPGTRDEEPPEDGLVWHGYYDAANRVLSIYASGKHGLSKIAQIVNGEGWPYRNQYAKPAPFDRESVRRVVKNWIEYGGAVIGQRAKDRSAKDIDPEAIALHPERAVFDVELLRDVGRVFNRRSVEKRHADYGVHVDAHVYALSGLLYCSHCDKLAREKQDPSLRHAFTGQGIVEKRRYRHKENTPCGTRNRSIRIEIVEREVIRLVSFLTTKPEFVPIMAEWFASFSADQSGKQDGWEAEVEREISYLHEVSKRLDYLFKKARITLDEYEAEMAENERQIARLQARLGADFQVNEMLRLSAQSVEEMARNWDTADPVDKQSFARTIFSEIIFDLDTRRIVDFKMAPYAEAFLQMRVTLEEFNRQQNASAENDAGSSEEYTPLPLWGFEPQFQP